MPVASDGRNVEVVSRPGPAAHVGARRNVSVNEWVGRIRAAGRRRGEQHRCLCATNGEIEFDDQQVVVRRRRRERARRLDVRGIRVAKDTELAHQLEKQVAGACIHRSLESERGNT